jgi:hypothetical protein
LICYELGDLLRIDHALYLGLEGFAPSFSPCHGGVLLLDDKPITGLGTGYHQAPSGFPSVFLGNG